MRVSIRILDIAGEKGFHFLHQSFLKNSRAAIIVYSLGEDDQDKEDSFNQISKWYDEIMKHCGDKPIIIIANKADLVDKSKLVSSNIQEFVNDNNLVGHYITSTKTGKGVVEAFNLIIETLYSKYKSFSAKL